MHHAEEQGVKSMLTSSQVACCACAAGHSLQGVQANALMPHLMTVYLGLVMRIDTCNTGQMA